MSDEGVRDVRLNAKPQARRSGRGLASFATLIALIALGAAGYPYYQRLVGSDATETNAELVAVRLAQQRQAEDLKRLSEAAAGFDVRLKQQQSSEAQQSVSATPTIAVQMPSAIPERALKLGEAEFLLRSANDRLLVTRDARAALAMLLAAQSLVDQIDDQSLGDVANALSGEIAALRDVSGVDVDATYRRLQAISRVILELPARGARYTSAPAPSTGAPDGAPPSAGSLAWQKFLSLFEFRRQGTNARPPLGPDEATYLRLNLGLMLQTAELALMRGDSVVYQQSLESVRRWLDDYLDTGAQDVANVRGEIDQLLAVRLDRSAPDMGSSLAALHRVLAATGAAIPSSPTSNPTSASESP